MEICRRYKPSTCTGDQDYWRLKSYFYCEKRFCGETYCIHIPLWIQTKIKIVERRYSEQINGEWFQISQQSKTTLNLTVNIFNPTIIIILIMMTIIIIQIIIIIDFWFVNGFCINTTCGRHLSIISRRKAAQSLCSVYTIRLIAQMSDRRSAAAEITQTKQSGHHHRENKNAWLILKRKRQKGGVSFFLAWGTFSFSVYQNTGCTVWFLFPCNYLVSIQTSCGLCGWDPVSSRDTWP